jgi:hypothetical protein
MPRHGPPGNPHGLLPGGGMLSLAPGGGMQGPPTAHLRAASSLLQDLLSPSKNLQGIKNWPREYEELLGMLSMHPQEGESFEDMIVRRQGVAPALKQFAQTAADAPLETAGAVGDALRQAVHEGGSMALLGPESFGGPVTNAAGTALSMAAAVPRLTRAVKGLDVKGLEKIADVTGGPKAMKVKRAADPDWLLNGTESLDPPTKSVANLDLNTLPDDEAQAIAARMNHLKRNPKTGHYVGAPDWVDTPEKLIAVRKQFDELVENGIAGADWYPRTQKGLREIGGPRRRDVELLVDTQGLYSPQAVPKVNQAFAAESLMQGAMKGQTGRIRTQEAADKVNQMYRTGARAQHGPKTGPYSGRIDPEGPDGVVNDIWQGRAWGYKETDGSDWDSGFSLAQHAWATAETHLAVMRANARRVGGKSDWDSGSVQAASWVYTKGKDLHEKKPKLYPTLEDGIAEANRTYPDFFQRQSAYGTDEVMPGASTGHMADPETGQPLAEASASMRADFEAKMPKFVDDEGRDIFFAAGGVPVRETKQTAGAYINEQGVLEQNLGTSTQPMVGVNTARPGDKENPVPLFDTDGPKSERVGMRVSPTSAAVMDAVAAIKGFLFTQEASAWHKPFAFLNEKAIAARRGLTDIARAQRKGDADNLTIPIDRPATPDEIAALNQRLAPLSEKYNVNLFPSDTAEGVTVFVQPNLPRGSKKQAAQAGKAARAKGQDVRDSEELRKMRVKVAARVEKELQPIVAEIFPDASGVYPAQVSGSYIPSGMEAENIGSGIATRILQDKVTHSEIPLFLEKIDADQRIRAKIERLIDQQLAWAKANNRQLRPDVLRALGIWKRGGLQGLFKALQNGAVLPTVAVPIIGGSMLMSEGET